jgi:hypothetical protein
MRCYVDAEDIHKVLSLLVNEKCLALAAFDGRDKARDMLGINLPQLEQVIQSEFSEQGVHSRCVNEPLPETPSLEQTLAATNTVLADRSGNAAILQEYDAQQTAPSPLSVINLEVQQLAERNALNSAPIQASQPLESAGDRPSARTPSDRASSDPNPVAETERSLAISAPSLMAEEEQPVIATRSRQEPLESSTSIIDVDSSAKPQADCRSQNSQVLPITGSLANFFQGEMSLSDALQLSNALPKVEAANAPDRSKQSQTPIGKAKLQLTETRSQQLCLFATTNNSTPTTSSVKVPANSTDKPRKNPLCPMQGGEQLSLLNQLGELAHAADNQDMAVAQARSQQTDRDRLVQRTGQALSPLDQYKGLHDKTRSLPSSQEGLGGNNAIAATSLDVTGQNQSQLIQDEALETARAVQQLLKQLGTLQADGSIIFEGERWQFACRGDLVTITVKQEQRQILQVDGGRVVVFSPNSEEREKLQQFRQDVNRDLQQPQPEQQQQRRQGLSR